MDELMDKNLPYFVGGNLATVHWGGSLCWYDGLGSVESVSWWIKLTYVKKK